MRATTMSIPTKHGSTRRSQRLVDPRLQLKLSTWFLGLAVLALVFQYILLTTTMSSLSLELGGDAAMAHERIMSACMHVLGISLAVVLPATLIVGVLVTFRIAGPIARFTRFLEEVRADKRPADCQVRRGDELQDFCRLLNEATAPLRTQRHGSGEHEDVEEAKDDAAAA